MKTFQLHILIVLAAGALLYSEASFTKHYGEGQLLGIILPKFLIEEFEYKPTDDGYKLSYELYDGYKREEYGLIPNAAALAMGAHKNTDPERPRPNIKNRKLSPKSLQSLAG